MHLHQATMPTARARRDASTSGLGNRLRKCWDPTHPVSWTRSSLHNPVDGKEIRSCTEKESWIILGKRRRLFSDRHWIGSETRVQPECRRGRTRKSLLIGTV